MWVDVKLNKLMSPRPFEMPLDYSKLDKISNAYFN